MCRRCTHPVETDDEFVAVVLVLVGARLDWEVREGSRDPWQKEVDHGPQLFQSVLEGIADEENSLLTVKDTFDTQLSKCFCKNFMKYCKCTETVFN